MSERQWTVYAIAALLAPWIAQSACGSDEGGSGPVRPAAGGDSGADVASDAAGAGGKAGSAGTGGVADGGGAAGTSGTSGSGGVAGSSGAAGAAGQGGAPCVPPQLPPPEIATVEIGGSNYVMWDVSTYLADTSKWYAPLALKPVIGTYHLGPQTVRDQLADMAAKGQKQIALMLWYMPIDAGTDGDGDGVYGHVLDSSLSELRPQHKDNLIALLTDIRCAGFNRLYFRFATQGGSDASGWAAWNEPQFQQNWNFLANTRTLVDTEMTGSGVEVVYDLSAELGGITSGQAGDYTKKLWQNVTYVFGTTHTYGYSFATAPGRLTAMIGIYDQTGARPSMYAFDIYGDETNTMNYLASELTAAGDQGKPIVVQETFYNDAQANTGLRGGAAAHGLDLRSIFQWPMARGATTQHFSMNYPAEYSAFLAP
jgi:hypothetical protein